MPKPRRRAHAGSSVTAYVFTPPASIGSVVEFFAEVVVTTFTHGALTASIALQPEGCLWRVGSSTSMPEYAGVARFDPNAPLLPFLAARCASDPEQRRRAAESAIITEVMEGVRTPRGWKVAGFVPLHADRARGVEGGVPETLGDLAAVLQVVFLRAFASGALHLQYEFYPHSGIVVFGDDGDPDDVRRALGSDDAPQFLQYLGRNVSLWYGGRDLRVGEYAEA